MQADPAVDRLLPGWLSIACSRPSAAARLHWANFSCVRLLPEAKAAGLYVFGGSIDEDVPPVLVPADGAVTEGSYPWAPSLNGGFTVLEPPSREEAVAWVARIAKAHAPTAGPAAAPAASSPARKRRPAR